MASAIAVLALTGCAGPEFDTPIRWEGGALFGADAAGPDDPALAGDAPMSLELRSGGRGVAGHLPQGVTQATADGGSCVAVEGPERYSGEFEWRTIDEWTLEISFSSSTYLVTDGGGKFGSQNWGEVRIWPCSLDGGFWQLGAACGSPGPSFERFDLPECTEVD